MEPSGESIFQDLNVDPIRGTELLETIGTHPSDFRHDHAKFQKVLEVVEYFAPYYDSKSIINRVLRGTPSQDRVNKLYEYVTLRKEKTEALKRLEQVEKDLSYYE